MILFKDRHEAGRILAQHLAEYKDRPDVLVLGLPRGGVPVAYEVSKALHVPMDILVVRKVGVPGFRELAMGAVASNNTLILDRTLIQELGITPDAVTSAVNKAKDELDHQETQYRQGRNPPEIRGKTIILIDDGLATGSSMRAAIEAVRAKNAATIVVAVPLSAKQTFDALRETADRIVCAETPEPFEAVGLWYENFGPTSDEEIHKLLNLSPAPLLGKERGS